MTTTETNAMPTDANITMPQVNFTDGEWQTILSAFATAIRFHRTSGTPYDSAKIVAIIAVRNHITSVRGY